MARSTIHDERVRHAAGAGTTEAPDRGVDADRPTEIPPPGWKDVAKRVKEELRDDHSSLSAAGVAYFAFLSLLPALAAVVSLYGLFADPQQVRERVRSVFGSLPGDARQLLESQLSRIVDKPGSALSWSLAVSLALALWSASSGVAHLIEAVNIAYDEPEDRGFVKRRGQALAFTLAGVVAAIGVTTVLAVLPGLGPDSGIGHAALLAAGWAVAAIVVLAGLAALYRFGPDRDDPKWRWVTPGSAVALVGWLVVSIGLQLYAANFGSYDATYGALAAVVLLLIWLFLSALLVIVGAQLNAELEHQTARDSTEGRARPLGARGAEMADEVAPQPS
jgi:membrane protein